MVVAGVDGDGVDRCGVLDLVGGVEHRRVLRRGGGVAGGVGGPVGGELGLSGVVEADQLRALVEGRDPVTGERPVGRVPAAFGAGVRPDVFGAEERVAVVGVRHRAGGRGGGGRPPGGGRGGAGVPGGAGRRGPGAKPGRPPPGGHRGLGGGGVRAPHQPGGRPAVAYALSGPEPCAAEKRRPLRGFGRRPAVRLGRAAGSVYQNQLQRALSLRLGVAWGPDRHNTREMQGFSRAQLRAFSKRSAQIEAELEAKGALLRVAGAADAGRRRGVAGHQDGQGPLAHPEPAGRAAGGSEAAEVGLAVGAELEQAVCWREPAAASARLGGGRRRPGRPGDAGCAPGRPASPKPTWSSTSAPFPAAGCQWRRSSPWPTGSSAPTWRCA